MKVKLGAFGSLVFFVSALAPAFMTASVQTNQPLAGTKWKVIELNGKPVQRGYYLSLKPTEQMHGDSIGLLTLSDWCNDQTGYYSFRDRSLRIRLVTSTLVACRIGNENNGRSFSKALGQTSAFTIHGEILQLLNQDEAVVARLAADRD
jgi:heat shock protein HslJ